MTSTVDIAPDQLVRLLEFGRALVSGRDPEKVLRRVLDAACELTGARYAALGILDDDRSELARFLTVGIDAEARRAIGALPRGHGVLGELIRNPKPLRMARIGEHPRSYGFPAGHPEMSTFLGVPIRIRGEVFGNLYLTEKADSQEFDETDEHVVGVLAEWAAVAVDNARAHAESDRRRDDLQRALRGLEANVSLDRAVSGETDLARVLELIVKRGRALVDARGCAVLLSTDEGLCVARVAGELDPDSVGRLVSGGSSILRDVIRAGAALRVEGRALGDLTQIDSATEYALLIPLRSRGADLGVLCAFDVLGSEASFDADDQLALESFGINAASAIQSTQAVESEMLRLSITSSERERRRWARELHDETLQELGALHVFQDGASRLDDLESLRSVVAQSRTQVEGIIDGLRDLITELRPAALDELGAAAAVEALVRRFRERTELEIDLDVDLDYEEGRAPERHTPELEAIIYRTVQEALNNIVKHADASRVRIAIEEAGGEVAVTVDDDGRGLRGGGRAAEGFGLIGMRERAGLVGGKLSVTDSPEGGTRVRAALPVSWRSGQEPAGDRGTTRAGRNALCMTKAETVPSRARPSGP